jgi:type VI secretion system protein ImpK
MNLVPYNESFLLSQFREFYTEVIRLKRLVKSSGWWVSPAETGSVNGNGSAADTGTWVYFPESDSAGIGAMPATAKSRSLAVRSASQTSPPYDFIDQPPSSDQTRMSLLVWQSLLALFRRNAMHVLRVSGAPTESYFEAQYVMAAFADEVFIHLDWEGQRTWTSNLLESTLFHSHVAGQLFFDKLDRLLQHRDPGDKSLAAVYLTALSLGFRGKYHGVNDHGRLRRYRQELFGFVFQHPTDLANESKIAFPDAYVQTLRSEKKKLTNPRVWLGVLGLVLLGYLAVSHGIWLSLTSRLEEANRQVVEIENRLSPNSVKR